MEQKAPIKVDEVKLQFRMRMQDLNWEPINPSKEALTPIITGHLQHKGHSCCSHQVTELFNYSL